MNAVKFNTSIGTVADPESSRYALGNVLVTPEGYAVATDGRIMAVVPVETDLDRHVLVPRKAAQHKGQIGRTTEVNCQVVRFQNAKGDQLLGQVGEGRFPNFAKVMPALDVLDREKYAHICLDTELLHRLAQALGSCVPERRGLEISVPLRYGGPAVVVGGRVGEEGIGVIMPLASGYGRNDEQCTADCAERYEQIRTAVSKTELPQSFAPPEPVEAGAA